MIGRTIGEYSPDYPKENPEPWRWHASTIPLTKRTAEEEGACEGEAAAVKRAKTSDGAAEPEPMTQTTDPAERAEALKAEGNARLNAKDFEAAEQFYSQAIDLNPNNEVYFTNRALARTNLKRFEDAANDCRSALQINPSSARAYGRLGSAMFQAEKYEESRDAYQKALNVDPENATYKQGLSAAEAKLKPTVTTGVNDTAGAIQSLLASVSKMAQPTATKVSVKDANADFGVGLGRSMRAKQLFDEIKADYDAVLAAAAAEGKPADLEPVHERSALKCLELARVNGGIYNKAAQFVASLQGGAGEQGVPKAYTKALAVCTDQAPFRPFSYMEPVLLEEFGRPAAELFRSVDGNPIAAASLAQVHRAVTLDGEHVAVKLLYPNLRRDMASDFAVFRMMSAQIKPAGFDLTWLVEDFERAMAAELDFEVEARNAARTAHCLRHRPDVRVPAVVASRSCKSVLTMTYEAGLLRVDRPDDLAAAHLRPLECGQLISDVFAELALCHGHVHGDPHSGNIYLRPGQCSAAGGGGGRRCKPELVILDHGLYHAVGDAVRTDLCRLVLAALSPLARGEVKRLAARFAGSGLARFFPLLLSPWFVLASRLSRDDLAAAAAQRLPPSVSLRDVAECLVAIRGQASPAPGTGGGGGVAPRCGGPLAAIREEESEEGNMLGVLHSLGYVRGLLKSLSFPERRRLKSLVRYAAIGLLPPDERAAALARGVGALSLRRRAALAARAAQVDVLAVAIPALAAMGPAVWVAVWALEVVCRVYEFWASVWVMFARVLGCC